MKCGFYDLKKRQMVEVEEWPDSLQSARVASAHMTALYLSGRHRMPSPIWCLWDGEDVNSIFLLDQKPRKEEVLNHVLTLLVNSTSD